VRVLVCGGRDFNDKHAVRRLLKAFPAGITVVQGAAPGADTLAKQCAVELRQLYESYPAEWELHGKAAGPIRNRQMLDSGVDLVVAFPGGRGTEDTIRAAKQWGVPVVRVES
jgi:hypothetical protein